MSEFENLVAPISPDFPTIKPWKFVNENTLEGSWAEDGSTYEIKGPKPILEILLKLQHILPSLILKLKEK
ncbi:MAG: hypothetical protein RBR32_03715 [Bacteroidales bacterium]|nr:hypothetical protein [Bacteroidales bacterium]